MKTSQRKKRVRVVERVFSGNGEENRRLFRSEHGKEAEPGAPETYLMYVEDANGEGDAARRRL